MNVFAFVIAIVAIGAGSSAISSIASALRPKMRDKDIERIKSDIRAEFAENRKALPAVDSMNDRLEYLEDRVRELSDENEFLKRLIDKDQ